jgi:hypothetical protein
VSESRHRWRRQHAINRWSKHKGGKQPTCKQSRCEGGNDETTSRNIAGKAKVATIEVFLVKENKTTLTNNNTKTHKI